jgi:periplasmic copper chaperone A
MRGSGGPPPAKINTVRRLTPVLRIAGAALLAALVVTGCASARASSIAIASAYVPQPTTPGTTVAYLEIRNNGPADKLISVRTSVGGKVQLRAPVSRQSGVMTMRTVPDIPIAANAMTRLNPISYHLLITGAGTMHDGKDIMLRLTFANAGTVTVIAMVTNPQSGGSSYFLN